MLDIRNALIVFIGPLIPVALLYWLFGQINYFGLEGLARNAVSAGGPIAAYVFLFWYAPRQLRGLCISENADRVAGEWHFEAESSHGRSASGSCRIVNRAGELEVSGTYEEGGYPGTSWASEFAVVNGSRLVFLANVETAAGTFKSIAHLHLTDFDGKRFRKLKGNWESFQNEKRKRGGMTFTRNP